MYKVLSRAIHPLFLMKSQVMVSTSCHLPGGADRSLDEAVESERSNPQNWVLRASTFATLSDRNSLKEVAPNQSCFVSKIFAGLKDYWKLLSEKRDAVVEVPLARKEPQDFEKLGNFHRIWPSWSVPRLGP